MRRILLLCLILYSIASGQSVEQTIFLNAFNAGELSPLMNSRVDFPKYRLGASTLENMLVRTQGPITRRPGTKYIASVKDADDDTRLFPFEKSDEYAYIIELGDEYARFYRSGAQIMDGDDPYEIVTPWAESDVFEIQYAQDADTMRLVHPDYEPYVLSRTDHDEWSCVPIDSTTGPFIDENNDKEWTLTPSGTGYGDGFDYYAVGEDSSSPIYYTKFLTQTFTATDTYTSSGVKLKLFRSTRPPGTITVTLKATTGGKPTGNALATGTTDGDSLPTGDTSTGVWRQIQWSSNVSITEAAVYAIIVNISNTYSSYWYNVRWRMDGTDPSYTGGSGGYSLDSGTNWTMTTDVDFMFDVVVYDDEDVVNSNLITVTASAPTFDANHVGALYQISHLLEAGSTTARFAASGDSNSTSVIVQKYRYYDVITAGLWAGQFNIQRSYDSGVTWEDVYGITYNYNGNIQFAGQELEETCLYRMAMRDQVYTSHNARQGEAFCDASLNTRTFINNGVVEIATVTDANTATAYVRKIIGGTTATWRWAEGAWSDYRGWPRTIEHHEGRVIYGGSKSYPQTVWASIIVTEDDDYDDFTANTESDAEGNLGGPDDIAWIYTLPGKNPIQWMKSGGYLLIGTSSGVGKLGQPDKPITPNFPPTFRTQNYNGCAYMQPVGAVDSLLYIERGDEKVRELAYRYLSSQYVAPDMTLLSEHITGDGIDDIAFQNRPDPVLWCVREDGELLSFTYQRSSEVMAWGRNDTGASGLFKSVATIPGSTDEDELWAVVGRTVDSTAVKYVEQFQTWDWGTDQNDCWFVDCAGDDITDLARLEGETVALWGDGRPIGTYTVSSGIISPTGSYTNTTVGLPYTSVYETMPLVVQDRSGNYLSSQETNIHSVLIDFYKTLGCHVGVDSTNAEDFEFSTDSFATTIAAITDYKDGPVFEGTKRAPTLYFYESSPVPMTIRSVKATVEVEL